MKTEQEWMRDIAGLGTNHKPDCGCERCYFGSETVLILKDITEIQIDALKWASDQFLKEEKAEVAHGKIVCRMLNINRMLHLKVKL